ncbi:ABC transporter [Halococcus sp. PRR34]|uniref:fluoroquinolone export ABC transporter permease subunit n=1 Tax=Halococcus sp. PRR34 TaxID=3020830 RepID=UPI00235F2DB9|nr:ABC transporter [Halococcus sp. PRR34]
MSALRSMLAWDVRLQRRYGFYAVYAILTVVFVLGLRAVGPGLRTDAAVLLIVTDPTVLGFYFIASIVLFEKEEGVLDALTVSPLGDRGYLVSKVISLSLLAVVAATSVAVFGHGSPWGLAILVVGVALSASLFVLVGFVAVARFDSINEYFISAVGWGTILFLPLFGYVGVLDTQLFYVLPVQPTLVLVTGGFEPLAAWEVAYGTGYLLVGNAVAYVWARRAFRRHVVRGGDPGDQFGRGEVPRSRERSDRSGLASRSPAVGLALADLRNWVRDPMLSIAAVGPLVLSVIIRFGTPIVADMAAPVLELSPYYPVVAGSMAAFGPAIYGFVVGMFVLEDREQGVLAAYRVSPLSARGYLLYRGGTAYVLSLLATLPALAVIGLVPVSPAVLIGTAAVSVLGGPVLALGFGTLASNTIEGLAISKLVNVLVLGPAVVIAVVPEPLQFVAGALPTYWPVKAFVAGTSSEPIWPLYLFVGGVSHLLVLAWLGRTFARRAD